MPETSPGSAYRWRWIAVAALLIGQAMDLLDATIVQIAAPTIHGGLGGGAADLKWFTGAYTLPFSLLLITGGRLGDIVGRRRMFVFGVVGFLLASLACAFAPSAAALIAFRALQGTAAAAAMPQTIGLMRAMFRGPELGRALASIGPVMGLAGVCGPLLGGVLVHADLFGSSWRAVFLVNAPLSLVVLGLASLLPEDRAPRRPGLDPLGVLAAVAGIALIVYPLNEISSGWPTAREWSMIAAGLVVLTALTLRLRRAARAGRSVLIEPSLFANRRFTAALVTSMFFFAVTTGLSLVVVMQMQLGLGRTVLTTGLTLVPSSLAVAAGSWLGGSRPRGSGRGVMLSGVGTLLAGVLGVIAVYRTAAPHGYPTPLLGAVTVEGFGVGLFCSSFFATALSSLRPQQIGSAAGLLNAVQQLGATLGVAVLGSVYLGLAGHTPAASLHAGQAAFWVGGAMLAPVVLGTALLTAPAPSGAAIEPAGSPSRPAPVER
ncbi:MFS transporter [Actinospica durhamensis]|uniref:MFS transporter n=1 Tax=Actinospica durhamensis TaxID=1508375 RepID=A0A941IPE9_9ACTN|nr:MFS transporter [Actinospica durhamensis]MBR7831883.1 MFS transporter [Actinospica durhamensis]